MVRSQPVGRKELRRTEACRGATAVWNIANVLLLISRRKERKPQFFPSVSCFLVTSRLCEDYCELFLKLPEPPLIVNTLDRPMEVNGLQYKRKMIRKDKKKGK